MFSTAQFAALGIAIALVVAGMSAATQFIAQTFDHQAVLGSSAVLIGDTRLYAPWSVFEWTERWGEIYPKPFAVARLIVLAGFALAALAAALAMRAQPKMKPFGKNAWANFHDVEAAGLLASSGTILGRLDDNILAFEGPEHQLLIGASRSGKGRGQVVPTLLAWPHSAVVLDVKAELADGDLRHGFPGTAGFRETLGPVARFAPTRADSVCFNPLMEVRRGPNEVRDVQNILDMLIDPASKDFNQDFWNKFAKNVLTGVVLHVLYAEPVDRKTLAVVRQKLRDLHKTAEEMRLTLHRLNPKTNAPEVHPEVLHAAESFLAGEERLQAGVKATAESYFGLFADPIVAEKTSRSDFRIGDLMCGRTPVTLYLQPPPSDSQRLMPLMRLIINFVARSLMESQTQDAQGREKTQRLLLLLDEFPQLGRMSFFETAMAAMAGYGIKCFLVCQSLNHITRAYGRDNVILDNAHVITTFAAADAETAKRISEMAGDVYEMRPQESVHRPRTLLGPHKGAITYREERRPLLLPGDVRQLKRDEQLVFVSGMKPLKAKKLKFDQERVFTSRLMRATQAASRLTATNDWAEVAPLGRLAPEKKRAPVSTRPAPPPARAQQDLFDADAVTARGDGMSVSEQALAGFRNPDGSRKPPPVRAPLQASPLSAPPSPPPAPPPPPAAAPPPPEPPPIQSKSKGI